MIMVDKAFDSRDVPSNGNSRNVVWKFVNRNFHPSEQLIRQCSINAFYFPVVTYCRFLDELISKTTVNNQAIDYTKLLDM